MAWKAAIERRDGPSALIFSRQNLAPMERSDEQLAAVAKGGYVLKAVASPDAIIIATGSEVELAMQAADAMAEKGKQVSVVSMPSVDVFLKQDAAYRESVLPASVRARVAVEAGMKDYWYKFVGLDGAVVGMESFGESAPAGELFKQFGFTVDNIVATVESVIG